LVVYVSNSVAEGFFRVVKYIYRACGQETKVYPPAHYSLLPRCFSYLAFHLLLEFQQLIIRDKRLPRGKGEEV
jgi:hypothetical protein